MVFDKEEYLRRVKFLEKLIDCVLERVVLLGRRAEILDPGGKAKGEEQRDLNKLYHQYFKEALTKLNALVEEDN